MSEDKFFVDLDEPRPTTLDDLEHKLDNIENYLMDINETSEKILFEVKAPSPFNPPQPHKASITDYPARYWMIPIIFLLGVGFIIYMVLKYIF